MVMKVTIQPTSRYIVRRTILSRSAYGREIEHLIRRSITHISKTEFFPAFYAAFQLTMTEANIKGGFRGAGLVPFDPEVVISKLDAQLRTPTPIEEVAQQAQSWTSRTPRTALEAGSQSEYLQRRIRRHHSSSPESILEALRSLEKGTKAVMHKVALLAAENRDLRQANEILSRRRRAKRTRLQNRGSMTIGEDQDLINQMDVDMQVVAEVSRSGGRGSSARPRVRRCRTCSKTGHNARTCQEGIEASGDEYSS
ncbi:transposase [Fusarium oxysporum f. sp. phaseoli]